VVSPSADTLISCTKPPDSSTVIGRPPTDTTRRVGCAP
jgi:hypothetical protein